MLPFAFFHKNAEALEHRLTKPYEKEYEKNKKSAEKITSEIEENIRAIEEEIKSKRIRFKRLSREADRLEFLDYLSSRSKRNEALRYKEKIYLLEKKLERLKEKERLFSPSASKNKNEE